MCVRVFVKERMLTHVPKSPYAALDHVVLGCSPPQADLDYGDQGDSPQSTRLSYDQIGKGLQCHDRKMIPWVQW